MTNNTFPPTNGVSSNLLDISQQHDVLGKRKLDSVHDESKRLKLDWMEEEDNVDLPSTVAPKPDENKFPILQNHYKTYNIKENPILSQGKTFFPQAETGNLHFFWMDVFEESRMDASHRKGPASDRFFIFGKRYDGNGFKSVCLIVENMYHDLWLLPHEEVLSKSDHESIMEEEVSRITAHITGAKHRFEERAYCFELQSVPLGTTKYVNLRIPGKYDPIKLENNRVFKHVFGLGTSYVEQFLIKKKVNGPSWLTAKNVKESPGKISYCDEEYTVDYKDISNYVCQYLVPASPPVKALSISVQTMFKDQTNIVIAISGILHKRISIDGPTHDDGNHNFTLFSCVFNPFLKSNAKTEQKSHSITHYCSTEKEVISKFAEFVRQSDPDVIIGHNFLSFHLNAILLRCKALRVSNLDWSCYGRIRRSQMPKIQARTGANSGTFQERMIVSGRLIADTYLASVEYLREKSNSLVHLAKSQLDRIVYPIDNDENALHPYFLNQESVERLVLTLETHCYVSILLVFKLALLPLTRELSSIAGNVWSKSLTGNRAERIEYLLLHNFHSKKYILPDKRAKGAFSSKRGKAKYGGGFVLEPKAGLYDKYVLLLDFNSLYPSLILQHNICFTTIDRPRVIPLSNTTQSSTESTGSSEKAEPFFASPPENLSHDTSVLPNVLKSLLERRNQVKRDLEKEGDPHKRWLYDIRQKALKLTANSCYGCLGFAHSRFYCEPLAELITRKGRELLQSTKDMIENTLGYNIIYGDTDSVMVLTPFDNFQDAVVLGKSIRDQINQGKKFLEIGIDGYFRRILLLKKKKYVAELHTPDRSPLGYSSKKEIKGVEIVRRDWCELSRSTSIFCVEQILSEKTSEEVAISILEHLEQVAERVRQEGHLENIDDYILYKGLSKMPSEYPDAEKLPHVCVAQEMINQGKSVNPGMRIAFVICNEARNDNYDSISYRAYPVDEYVKRKDLTLDQDYYLGVQIFPPITRLCQHIEGVSRHDIAHKLGLDVSKYGASHEFVYSELDDLSKNWDIYQESEPIVFPCQSCGKDIMWNLYKRLGKIRKTFEVNALFSCDSCMKPIPRYTFQNKIYDEVRKALQRYYACNAPSLQANASEKLQSVSLTNGKTIFNGKLKKFEETFSSLKLRSFLLHMDRMVNYKDIMAKWNRDEPKADTLMQEDKETLDELIVLLKSYLDRNASNMINLSHLFR